MRAYKQADILQAAQIIEAIGDDDDAAAIWSSQQIKAAFEMLKDIAAGLGDSGRIICTGEKKVRTDIEN
jgi:hypothetical protein